MQTEKWLNSLQDTPEKLEIARKILDEIRKGVDVFVATRHYPLTDGGFVPKHTLVAVYHRLVESGEWASNPAILSRIRMKPVRSLSGVTTVTVLTKPYPCPGRCIFCPDDTRMPKSYLPDEPGAMRGLQNGFDPYLQVSTRLTSYRAVGHPVEKIELLILGGTWSSYRRDYQEEFVKRCFDALNGKTASSLQEAQLWNQSTPHRNVGLVIETRPDEITPVELAWLRRLGVTKVQMGTQSLDPRILAMNQRGHTVLETKQACALLRAAGFKIVLHWMPNLLGATLDSDREDFTRLWHEQTAGLGLCPDEIKIYPTQLLKDTELYECWKRGEYNPYTTEELIHLIADIKPGIPEYCRVNRVIRDIPSPHVVEGNKRTSLRMDVLAELDRRGQRCIRCREIRQRKVNSRTLELHDQVYHASDAEEHFLSYVSDEDRLAGYLRLSLPDHPVGSADSTLPLASFGDLEGAALIREVHVYGQSLALGAEQAGAAQHSGLGKQLLEKAAETAKKAGFHHLAVIAAVGTRQYYEKRGFKLGELYMVKKIS